VGSTYEFSDLVSAKDVVVTIGNGAEFRAPNVQSFTYSTLTLGDGQTLEMGLALTDIDNSRFLLSGERRSRPRT